MTLALVIQHSCRRPFQSVIKNTWETNWRCHKNHTMRNTHFVFVNKCQSSHGHISTKSADQEDAELKTKQEWEIYKKFDKNSPWIKGIGSGWRLHKVRGTRQAIVHIRLQERRMLMLSAKIQLSFGFRRRVPTKSGSFSEKWTRSRI